MTSLLILSASNGENLKLAECFATAGRQQGCQISVIDLTSLQLPLFTPRAQAGGNPAGLDELEQLLRSHSHWVICTPEYNGSIPPVLTSAIAWLSVLSDDFRALFNGRPVAMATHSGSGGYEVLTALRIQLAHLGAHVVGRQLVSNRAKNAEESSITAILDALLKI